MATTMRSQTPSGKNNGRLHAISESNHTSPEGVYDAALAQIPVVRNPGHNDNEIVETFLVFEAIMNKMAQMKCCDMINRQFHVMCMFTNNDFETRKVRVIPYYFNESKEGI